MIERFETELLVEAVSVECREHEAPQTLQIAVFQDRLHQLLGNTFAAVFGQHKNMSKIRKRREVGNHARETNLFAVVKNAETKRMADRTLDKFARNVFGPIRSAEKIVNHIEIEAGRIS